MVFTVRSCRDWWSGAFSEDPAGDVWAAGTQGHSSTCSEAERPVCLTAAARVLGGD